MASKSLVYPYNATRPRGITSTFSCPRGEAIDIDITVLDSSGSVRDLTGYELVLSWDANPTAGLPTTHTVTGDATGKADWHFHGSDVAEYLTDRQYDIALVELANPGDPVYLTEVSFVRINPVVADPGPWRYYYGAGITGLSSKAQIEALSRVDLSDKTVPITATATLGQYLYFAFPTVLGTALLKSNGFTVLQAATAATTATDADAVVRAYTICRTSSAVIAGSHSLVAEVSNA